MSTTINQLPGVSTVNCMHGGKAAVMPLSTGDRVMLFASEPDGRATTVLSLDAGSAAALADAITAARSQLAGV